MILSCQPKHDTIRHLPIPHDLIQEDLFKNAEKIEEISETLTDIERFTIFEKYEKNPMLPFYANLAVGFGVGSFIQGDIAGAVIALTGDGLGVALPILGYACIMQDYYGYWDSPYGYELMYAGFALIGISLVVLRRTEFQQDSRRPGFTGSPWFPRVFRR